MDDHSRGCVTVITERDRIETESALNEVRRSSSRVLLQDLEKRDGKAGPHEAVNATVVAGTRVLRQVAFDVHWHILYANETYEGGYVPYVRFLPCAPCTFRLQCRAIIDPHSLLFVVPQ